MFTPSELESMPLALERLYKELEQRIMLDIVRRIKINSEVTRSADWQIYRLQQLGESKRTIKKYIKDTLELSNKEINHLYKDVIRKGYTYDEQLYRVKGKPILSFADNQPLKQLISAITIQTDNELENITQSLGFTKKVDSKLEFKPIAEYYQHTLDSAMMDITSGAFDYNTVLKRTVTEMVNSGLRSVDYATGWSNRIPVAARRAVMTGISQITAKIDEDNAKQLGTNEFEVSRHFGARPFHQPWQGRVYTKEQLHTVCGLGTGAGLCGWNCYHSYSPFIDGLSERTYTDMQLDEMNANENTPVSYKGRKYTAYEATQEQRRLETQMRAERSKIKLLQDGEAFEDDIINARARYRITSAEYVQFSKAMDLPQQRERVLIDGLGGIGKGKWMVDKNNKSGIIKVGSDNNVNMPPISGAFYGALNPDSVEALKHAESYYESVRNMKTDFKKIANNIGWDEQVIEDVKNHIFINKHSLGRREPCRFDPDYHMAQSWQRLIDGSDIQEMDIVLLQHEASELKLMKESGLSYQQAHELANQTYNYSDYVKRRVGRDE